MGILPPTNCDSRARVEPERAARIIAAVLLNIDVWIQQAEEIADSCPAGGKSGALHLARNMLHAKQALRRLAGLEEDGGEGRE